ncbi:hypothetical protein [Mycolicibacter senuensis]|uniref:hypothetical protein n=1 Tax=Mycolicibacter senuensis TaxID=386913 RepID=UPI000DCD1D46|nr:hypothetical protein [Mycolicibacter senuensis]RAU99475.1 hypothetical protein DQP56_10675 [Mycolicibacter senuensis]
MKDPLNRDDALLTALALIERHGHLPSVAALLEGRDMVELTRILASTVSVTRHCVTELAELLDTTGEAVMLQLRSIFTQHLEGPS